MVCGMPMRPTKSADTGQLLTFKLCGAALAWLKSRHHVKKSASTPVKHIDFHEKFWMVNA